MTLPRLPDDIRPDAGSQRGFTLIEMMIVVAIIAILASILVPNFVRARAQAQTAACEANIKEIATALELYETDNDQYPDSG
ncbi:MAG TPA: prepilin-type N-terminal cleavage/methylation domain-containing protein, partial [Candidatus Acidoferrales bacterium]|nr:prepilin-type N-terminal cleavage/methylation domain-containing protein [Candidatus Acidoferrales bacterium]